MNFQENDIVQKELNFIMNEGKENVNPEKLTQNAYMKMAYDVVFTQMSVNTGFKKYG